MKSCAFARCFLSFVFIFFVTCSQAFADIPAPPVPQKMPEGAAQLVKDREVRLSIWKEVYPRRSYAYTIDPGYVNIQIQMPGPCDYRYSIVNVGTGKKFRERKGSLDNLDFVPVSRCKDLQKEIQFRAILILIMRNQKVPHSNSSEDICYYNDGKFDFRMLEDSFGYNHTQYENDQTFIFNAKFILYDYEFIDGKPRLINKYGKTITFTRYITITANTCDVYHFDPVSKQKIIDNHQDFTGTYDEYRRALRNKEIY